MIEDDGPCWIKPSVGFPERDNETGQMVIKLSFTMPIAYLDSFFDTVNTEEFQQHFNEQLTTIMADNFDQILAAVDGE